MMVGQAIHIKLTQVFFCKIFPYAFETVKGKLAFSSRCKWEMSAFSDSTYHIMYVYSCVLFLYHCRTPELPQSHHHGHHHGSRPHRRQGNPPGRKNGSSSAPPTPDTDGIYVQTYMCICTYVMFCIL